ncbi:hypothetical protein VCRA2117O380_100104 [Vibrio crassostreae]|nr:hypothetical protein VCRA2117O379_100080 [Vibrio crassostreae]CAK1700058.1 hypothetical protein VCRA2119O382_100079 [Vibrio crassostreae]CAK1702520.1 hypothetical protein VCRA2117O380_100104 [Vibrio crassostreae]CAK2400419.1 hypothetical protein VCRA2113O350_110081 [Vibrio crassostreae]CAK2407143.1 hypothetical protein VCRA2111O136_120116 [Vibrio crassostreae]
MLLSSLAYSNLQTLFVSRISLPAPFSYAYHLFQSQYAPLIPLTRIYRLFSHPVSRYSHLFYSVTGNLFTYSFCELIGVVMKLIFHRIIYTILVFDNWIT